jgi:hypothetical protein
MKFCLVLAVLISVLGKAFSYGVPPSVSTIYSGTIAPAALWSDAAGNIYGCEPDFHLFSKLMAVEIKVISLVLVERLELPRKVSLQLMLYSTLPEQCGEMISFCISLIQ